MSPARPRPEPEIERDAGFLSRWSRRKVQARHGEPLPPAPEALERPTPSAPAVPVPAPVATLAESAALPAADTAAEPAAPPPPTLDEADALTPQADFTRFVARGVEPEVKNAALKKLFTDPHFNVMDGLDTYIDDYGKPDPLPASMLRQMAQARFLGLFTEDEAQPQATLAATPTAPVSHEDPDLRLQPDDAAGRAGPAPGPVGDPGREP